MRIKLITPNYTRLKLNIDGMSTNPEHSKNDLKPAEERATPQTTPQNKTKETGTHGQPKWLNVTTSAHGLSIPKRPEYSRKPA